MPSSFRIPNAATAWWTGCAVALGLSVWASQAASEMPQAPAQATAALPSAVIARTSRALEKPGLIEPQRPTDWLPSRGRECNMKGRYARFCQGPRRAPRPHGAAAALAQRLEIGTHHTVSELLLHPPKPAWVQAAGGPKALRPMLWPVDGGRFWRGFGDTRRSKAVRKRHKGVDIGAPDGTPIRAAQDGLVVYSDNGIRGFGNLIVIVHPDATTTFYAHCQANYVFPGQRVRRGQVIGEVGHTGIARGPHLHFEWRHQGHAKDPVRRFENAPPQATAKARPRARRARARKSAPAKR
jgi:murein DD-endopeptidase MepM/ murein hydrolase activator NlpD